MIKASQTLDFPDVEEEVSTEQDRATEPLWKIIAHDDPFTTMDFVVRLMIQVFNKPLIIAEAIMWQIHNEGLSVVDTKPKAEAEHLARKGMMAARLEGFPFKITVEPA